MKFNFEKDVFEWSKKTLSRLGYKAAVEDDSSSLLIKIFNVLRHKILPIPRKVKISREFSCPKKHIEGYNQIISEIIAGYDLSPRSSRKQINADSHVDGLLVDWNIHHLHFGTKHIKSGKKKGLIEGSKELLFVFFTDKFAYIIGIYDHKSWVKESVMAVINNNWPHLLQPSYIDKNVKPIHNISEADRKKLRDGNINTPLKIGSDLFFGPGGGFTSSGQSANENEKVNIVLRAVDNLTKWVNENEHFLIGSLSNICEFSKNESLKFEVSKFILSGTYTVQTIESSMRIHIPSVDKPASLVHASLVHFIEPDKDKYSYIVVLNDFFIEKNTLNI